MSIHETHVFSLADCLSCTANEGGSAKGPPHMSNPSYGVYTPILKLAKPISAEQLLLPSVSWQAMSTSTE